MKIKLNWALVLLFICYWNYGFYGSVLTQNVSVIVFALSTIIMAVLISFFAWLGLTNNKKFIDYFTFDWENIIILFSYLVIMAPLSIVQLIAYPKYDSLLHSASSKMHSLIISNKLYSFFPNIGHIKYKNLLFSIDLLIVISIILFSVVIYKISKKTPFIAIIIIALSFVALRTIIFSLGGFGSSQPSFRLFPIWLSSSLLMMSNLSFKLPGFLALLISMCFIYKSLIKKTNFLYAWLSGLAIGTIPILWYSGVIVEPSIWAAVIFIPLLIKINFENHANEFNFFRWLIIIIIGLLLRQSIIVVFIPFFLIMIKYKNQSVTFIKHNILYILLILMVWLPFFIFSLSQGTGSTEFIKEGNGVYVFVSNIYSRLVSGLAIKVFLRDIGIYLAVFFFFAFIPMHKKELSNILINLFSFLGFLFLFMSLPNYGEDAASRYQAEYIVPFILLGYYRLSIFINKLINYSYLLLIIPILIILINIQYFYNNYNYENVDHNKSNSIHFGAVYSCDIFDYKPVYNYLKKRNIYDKTIFIGSKNKSFSNILANYNIKDIEKLKIIENLLEYDPQGLSINSISKSIGVDYVVVENAYIFRENQAYDNSFLGSDSINGLEYHIKLLNIGCKKDTTFINDRLKSEITIYKL